MTKIRTIECVTPEEINQLLRREGEEPVSVDGVVLEILAKVRQIGDKALLDYTEQYDGARLTNLLVTREEIDQAVAQTEPKFLEILQEAASNITAYHSRQKRTGYVLDQKPGVVMGQRILPMDRVGVYVPGGTARYPSTVLMDVIPAKIAGVREIILATPPGKDGQVPSDTLAAAYIAGVDRIYKMGGAQAVAALSYGTETVPRVDKIVGPGNVYVATAKRMVYGQVDIDMIAGPSDILVVADDTARPDFVAADLLSQAEHDKLSQSVLVTTSRALAKTVEEELARQLEKLPRKEIASHAIENNSAIVITDTLHNAVEISNQIAPEHLELCVEEPLGLLPMVRHAGSIFLGHYAPEALGDYMAGPNHTLPTSGTARFASPLSVDDFCKRSSFLYYDRQAFEQVADKVALFAGREGLDAHAASVAIRMKEERE